jgi:hypothetical protein
LALIDLAEAWGWLSASVWITAFAEMTVIQDNRGRDSVKEGL